jgi:hypothetical protein
VRGAGQGNDSLTFVIDSVLGFRTDIILVAALSCQAFFLGFAFYFRPRPFIEPDKVF